MIKQISFIFLILLSIKTYSQKCNTDKDPFTNEEITSYNFYNKTVYFEIKNDTITFDIIFNYWGEREYEFKEGTEILIKLEDGNKIDLRTVKTAKPKIEIITSSIINPFFTGFGGGVSKSENFTAYSFTFLLNKTELKKLAESKIEIVRIPDTDEGEYVDLESKGRVKQKFKAIRKGANCITENI